MEMATTFGNQSKTLTKVDRYGWTIKDQPGFMKEINKSLLNVDMQYQRHANKSKVLTISSEWSWIACGVVVVAFRDGKYWVMDGQHRVIREEGQRSGQTECSKRSIKDCTIDCQFPQANSHA